MYAEVVVDIPSKSAKGLFHYGIPTRLRDTVRIGSAVLVPFGTRKLTGYIVGFTETPDISKVKDICKIQSDTVIPGQMVKLAEFIRDYYMSSLGEAIAQMYPASVRRGKARIKTESFVGLAVPQEDARALVVSMKKRAPRQSQTLETVLQRGPVISKRLLNKGPGSTRGAVNALIRKGILKEIKKEIFRSPVKGIPRVQKAAPTLTPEQKEAVAIIIDGLDQVSPKPYLLHGVTASGKTEIYMHVIESVLEKGRSAIVLVPEISLAPQMITEFLNRFGRNVAVLHSKLSPGERYDEWRRAEQGDAKIVIGARSAVFAPTKDLGIIVVDEEHENSYKQEESPRYHARNIACERAKMSGAVCLLGSATPSVESYYKALNGDYKLLELTQRVEMWEMPSVEIVDMREELAEGNKTIFSRSLSHAISHRLADGDQIILFLNRRGYSTFVLCRECGYSMKCPECDVPLTYHTSSNNVRCHYCDYSERVPSICPKCKGRYIKYFGAGTQKIEEEVKRMFPHARTVRMDTDTTQRKGAHESIVNSFKNGDYDILVGTQMVAKGLDFPNVTLVGVISADTCLNLPDYRAGERTFQLLTQVAGRAGRGEKKGHVIVQTYSPEHYSIKLGKDYNYKGFYNEEIACRKEGFYPPFSRLVHVVISGKHLPAVESYITAFVRMLQSKSRLSNQENNIRILGPAPCTLARIKGMHRWQALLKINLDADSYSLNMLIKEALEACPLPSYDIITSIDIDPGSML